MATIAIFKFIAKNPPMALIGGGILLLLLGLGGWILIVLGVILQVLWQWFFRPKKTDD